ncbi:class I SAM-dependent methyltransferase [Legionella yabuuchiae]|uniref:class I SAM-dependent methyltransferase n=1 Tax=Legionella yabuuchiae TaxID=376727 RepID=UPI001F5FDBD9|nr:class I SAM-dependent methyltransferase [Legionella yabuuchiae]
MSDVAKKKVDTELQISDNVPEWFKCLCGIPNPSLNKIKKIMGFPCSYDNGVWRLLDNYSTEQEQTKESFGYKWSKKDTFESEAMLSRMKQWLIERYGDISQLLNQFKNKPILLDAGCGAGMSTIELWKEHADKIRYLGVDVSSAIDICKERVLKHNFSDSAFIQGNITQLPLPPMSVDIIFSEGVMHHTDDTHSTFKALSEYLKPNGFFMFYIYHKKGPIREFVDDYIREKMQAMTPSEAWNAMRPLSKLGKLLGELDINIHIPEKIDLLDIPAGEINLQRFFYWHIFKSYYHPDLDLEEMNHINYDWYAPSNAHRHTFEEVEGWCDQASLEIIRHVVEPAGITVIAQRKQ